MAADARQAVLLETVGQAEDASPQAAETGDRPRRGPQGESQQDAKQVACPMRAAWDSPRPLAHEPQQPGKTGIEQRVACRARCAKSEEIVGVHPLPQRAEEEGARVTGGMLESPCYGSVWPVVWGPGVKISRLPDSLFGGVQRCMANT